MKLFDTHAHLNDKAFDADREEVIASLPASGIARVIDVACDLRELDRTLMLINKYAFIYGTVGMHPHTVDVMDDAFMDVIANTLKHEKMLALGEIGLDYHYDLSPRELQRRWFTAQLELAQALDVPVTLHIREAYGDAMDILRAHKKNLRGELHCFSGSIETAYECIDMGLYVALGGAVTFGNAVKQRDIAARLPIERLLIETDCPYMTPVPHRGKRNDPSLIGLTAERIASERGMETEELMEATYRNACALFGLPE